MFCCHTALKSKRKTEKKNGPTDNMLALLALLALLIIRLFAFRINTIEPIELTLDGNAT
jgi:hypothetical protein